MRALILHHFPFHYEMIPSILQQFKDYEIDMYLTQKTTDFMNWYVIYKQLNNKFNLVYNLRDNDNNYDVIIIDTDDDLICSNIYNQYYASLGIPCYIINHIKTGCRSTINKEYRFERDIHGIHKTGDDFHFCGYDYINVNDKINKLSDRVSVAIIGDIVNEEENFLNDMINRFENFDEIDFYIINRTTPYWYNEGKKYPNIKFFINCNTQIMFKILEKCHYVYFFGWKRAIKTCTASVGLSFSTLCRLLCCERCQSQYEIQSPIFKSMTDKFKLEKITKNDLENIYNERNRLIQMNSKNLVSLTK